MYFEVQTKDQLEYTFFANSSGLLEFEVRAPHDAYIALSTVAAEVDPMYEVLIGCEGNTKSAIRKNQRDPNVVEADTPEYLNADEFRGFWIRFESGNITVGRQHESAAFLNWTDHTKIIIEFVGFGTALGATGHWIVNRENSESQLRRSTGKYSEPRWVPARNGHLPPYAFAGGNEKGEPLYVARAQYNGGVIPGKLHPSHGAIYISLDGDEHAIREYEVLCDFRGSWMKTSENHIPENAFPGGQSSYGEILYIGRAYYQSALIIGKVQPNHGKLYIPYGGKEWSFKEYEILVETVYGSNVPLELETKDNSEYIFFPNHLGIMNFKVRAAHDAHIALTTVPTVSNPMYEVYIGGWKNTRSVIMKNRSKPYVADTHSPGYLDKYEFRGFSIRWKNGKITVGREGDNEPFLHWTDNEIIPIKYVGVSTAWGADGHWIIEVANDQIPRSSISYES